MGRPVVPSLRHLCGGWSGPQNGRPGVPETVKHESYCHGSFADGRGNALDGPAAHVPDSEDPRPAGLEEQRGPSAGIAQRPWDLWPGQEESVVIYSELAVEPLRTGPGADEHEEPTDGKLRRLLRNTLF